MERAFSQQDTAAQTSSMTNHPKTEKGHIKENDIFMRVNDVSRECERGREWEANRGHGDEGGKKSTKMKESRNRGQRRLLRNF